MISAEGVSNYLLGAGILVSLVLQGVQALYIRGKLDGKAVGHEGAQKVAIERLERDHKDLEEMVIQARDTANTANQSIKMHQEECIRNYARVEATLTRIEAMVSMGRRPRASGAQV